MKYRIHAGPHPLHSLFAEDAEEALRKWLDRMGYDTKEQAARENFCEPDELYAKEMIYIGPGGSRR